MYLQQKRAQHSQKTRQENIQKSPDSFILRLHRAHWVSSYNALQGGSGNGGLCLGYSGGASSQG